ncbi:MAG: DUF6443 domain-containing protein [Cytophagales bacterium]
MRNFKNINMRTSETPIKRSASSETRTRKPAFGKTNFIRGSVILLILAAALVLPAISSQGQSNPYYFPTYYNGQTGCSGGQVVSGSVSYFELRGYPASTVNATIGTYQLSGAGNWVEKGNVTVNGQVWGYKIYAKTWTSSGTVCMLVPGNPCMQTTPFTVIAASGTPSLSATTQICANTSYSDVTYTFPNSTYSNATLSPSSYGTISTISSNTRRITWNTSKPPGNVTFTLTGGNYACGDVLKSKSIVFNRQSVNNYTVSVVGPALVCANSGGSSTFTATVTGTYGGLTYQWYKGGAAVSGSGSTYTVADANLTNGVPVYCVVNTPGCGMTSAASNTIYVPVNTTPIDMPAAELRCSGATVSLEREPGTDIYWQTSMFGTSLSDNAMTKVSPAPGWYYLRRYANGCWSPTKSITVHANPTPGTVSVGSGFAPYSGSATLSGYVGTPVGWQKKIGSGIWYDINETGTTLQFTDLDKTSQFRAVLTNANGCVRIPSNPGTVTIYPAPPVVALGQAGFSYGGGDVVTLSTDVYDTYQWYKDGVIINGSTNQTLQVAAPGLYKVEITKYGKTVQSKVYNLGSLGEQKGLNVVSTTRVRVPGVTESTDFYSLDRSQVAQSVKYDDGLGRTIQQSVVGQTPGGKDMVQPVAYDQYGRASKQYLPYATADLGGGLKSNALSAGGSYTSSEQYLFYQNAAKVAHDTVPYARSIFDDTPLGRLLEQGAPGAAWQPTGPHHTVKNAFRVNTAGDNVRIWTTAGPKTTAPTNYAAGELAVSKTTDENGNEVLQFADKLGRLLLKRVQVGETIEGVYTEYLDTYYVYDIRGNLVLQVPPKASYKIATGPSNTWSPTFNNEWCFQYYYDEKNRLVEKKVPGSGIISYIYDPLDRIVLVQDAELKLTNKWLFVKYDSRQRPVMQGVYVNNTQVTRVNLQAGVADVQYTNPANPYFEARGTTLHGYTNVSFPTQNADASALQILSVNYYDDYDFDSNGTDDYSYVPQGISGESSQASAFGLPTGSKKVIEGTSNWLVSYIFYDKYGRGIQTRSNNHLILDGADLTTRVYDFEGKVLEEVSTHAQLKPLTWKNLVNVKVENNIISKTAGGAAWNAGTSSNEVIGAGQDGWIELVVAETNTQRMIGFSDVDSDQNYTSLDFAFYLNTTSLQVRENGTSKLTVSGGITTGTRLRIERKSNTVKYYRNGVLVYTSLTASSNALMVDMSLYTTTSRMSEVSLSASQVQLATVKRYAYDFSGRPLHVFQSINGQPEILTVSYEYNELGQMVEKNLHCLDCYDQALSEHGNTIQTTVSRDAYSSNETTLIAMESITLSPGFEVTAGNSFRAVVVPQEATAPAPGTGTYAQSVDMRYNIRGWLTSLNNAELTNDGTLNDDTGDYFGMELAYNAVDAGIGNTAYYNGNISSIKWKNPLSGTGAEGQRSYKYSYDKSDRLKSGTFQARGATLWNQDLNTLNETMTYDHNGNIKTLLRNTIDKTLQNNYTVTTAAEVMDNLTYSYTANNGNRLLKVEDSGTTDGFKNGSTVATEYTYNNNGSLKTDLNKGISAAITYNALGKPLQMTLPDNKKITYLYDGAGNKLSMKLYQNNLLVKTTDYVGGNLYENGALVFFSSPGGRVVKKGDNFEYQYAITDHQGNTRVLFGTDTPAPDTYAATFEDNTQVDEQSTFQNYPGSGSRSTMELFDHTDFAGTTYTYSQLLNGGVNGQVGLAKTLKVFPGDTINASVYAKYWNETSTTSNLAGFSTALTAAFGLTSGATGDALKAFNSLNDFGSVVVANNGSGSPSGPKAFITVLLFDNNFNFVDAAFDQIDPGAVQSGVVTKAAFDLLEVSYRVEKPGYAYIYLSNENPTLVDVYFDDMSISQTKSPVLQYNEYYPFGMQTMNSWTREDTQNQFLYNSATELNGSTGMYDLAFRNYDPVLGRFAQVDPLADMFGSLSPYHYADNSPIVYNDPDGLKKTKKEKEHKTAESAPGQGGKDNDGGMDLADIINAAIASALNKQYGGSWDAATGDTEFYSNYGEGVNSGAGYSNEFGWGATVYGDRTNSGNNALRRYNRTIPVPGQTFQDFLNVPANLRGFQTQNGPIPDYDLILKSDAVDVFSETIRYDLVSRTVFVQTLVGLEFNRDNRVVNKAGYQRTTIVTEDGVETKYSKAFISQGLADFVNNIEYIARPSPTGIDKWWQYLWLPRDAQGPEPVLSSGYLNRR